MPTVTWDDRFGKGTPPLSPWLHPAVKSLMTHWLIAQLFSTVLCAIRCSTNASFRGHCLILVLTLGGVLANILLTGSVLQTSLSRCSLLLVSPLSCLWPQSPLSLRAFLALPHIQFLWEETSSCFCQEQWEPVLCSTSWGRVQHSVEGVAAASAAWGLLA